MDYTYEQIAKMIDHSLLHPTMTDQELEEGCRVAVRYRVAQGRTLGEIWPIGWETDGPPRETLPAVVERINVEIDAAPLDETLAQVTVDLSGRPYLVFQAPQIAGERVGGLADLFRRIWRLGTAGVEVPMTVVRRGEALRFLVKSADRNDFLKKPRLH